MSPRSESERLEDILKSIKRIKIAEAKLHTAEKRGQWVSANTFFDAVLYNLVVIGEATKSLSLDLRDRNVEVSWKDIAGMRDILTHSYHRVLTKVVMETLDQPMAVLKKACERELGIIE